MWFSCKYRKGDRNFEQKQIKNLHKISEEKLSEYPPKYRFSKFHLLLLQLLEYQI